MELNEISEKIIGCAIKVHRTLGVGLLESTYEICLMHELKKVNLRARAQFALPVVYDGIQIDAGYRIDILVEDKVILELKTVEKLVRIHEAQLLTYLKLSGRKLGLLINFNSRLLKDGVKRLIN